MLEFFNEYGQSCDDNDGKLEEIYTQIHTGLVELWFMVITLFQDKFESLSEEDIFEGIKTQFEVFIDQLDEAIKRIERDVSPTLGAIITEKAEPFVWSEQGMSPHNENSLDEAKDVPCYHLPASRNPVFYGRENELKEIEDELTKQSLVGWTASVALTA